MSEIKLPFTPHQLKAMEYILDQLIDWYVVQSKKSLTSVLNGDNDLGKLKLTKLHFFLCSNSESLLKIFRFHALQYGPTCVRLVYEINKTGGVGKYEINNFRLKLKVNNTISSSRTTSEG